MAPAAGASWSSSRLTSVPSKAKMRTRAGPKTSAPTSERPFARRTRASRSGSPTRKVLAPREHERDARERDRPERAPAPRIGQVAQDRVAPDRPGRVRSRARSAGDRASATWCARSSMRQPLNGIAAAARTASTGTERAHARARPPLTTIARRRERPPRGPCPRPSFRRARRRRWPRRTGRSSVRSRPLERCARGAACRSPPGGRRADRHTPSEDARRRAA